MSLKATRPGITLETGSNELEIITFYLQFRNEHSKQMTKTFYGINAAKVVELIAVPQEITVIADAPDCVEGIFLARQRTVTLIDLCRWFRYEPDCSENTRQTWTVIVAELNGKPYGFITHGVDKVYRVSWEKISVPPDLVAQAKSLTGMCLVNNQIIQMVDFERIIAVISEKNDVQGHGEAVAIVGPDVMEMLRGKTVVIAEDSPTIRSRLADVLSGAGLVVVATGDGQQAWDYLEKVALDEGERSRIVAIVSDIEMPRMDGHHLCVKIKEHAGLRSIPVILFSSMINDAMRRKGLAVGADDQITKPEIKDVLTHIIACVEKRSAVTS